MTATTNQRCPPGDRSRAVRPPVAVRPAEAVGATDEVDEIEIAAAARAGDLTRMRAAGDTAILARAARAPAPPIRADAAATRRERYEERRLLLLAITIVIAKIAGGILLVAGLLLAGLTGLGIVLGAWLLRTIFLACTAPWNEPNQAVPLSRFVPGKPWQPPGRRTWPAEPP
jgi:hypothetical protein